jgi:hypothetical protein
MVVYYWTNYKPKDTDTQYKRKHKLLKQVFAYCQECGIECHPIGDLSHLILHVAISNKFNEDYFIVSEKFDDLPKIKDRFPFKTIKELLDNK